MAREGPRTTPIPDGPLQKEPERCPAWAFSCCDLPAGRVGKNRQTRRGERARKHRRPPWLIYSSRSSLLFMPCPSPDIPATHGARFSRASSIRTGRNYITCAAPAQPAAPSGRHCRLRCNRWSRKIDADHQRSYPAHKGHVGFDDCS